MKNRVTPTPFFENRFKKFSKKFPALDEEIQELEKELIKNPKSGRSLGNGLYKIRLASKDKGKGKSGGFRIITYLVNDNNTYLDIFLIIIYDKSEESSIKKSDLIKLAEAFKD